MNDLKRTKDFSTAGLTQLWKDKYASKRITALVNSGRDNLTDTLFYDDICYLTWEETKEKYLIQVGR